jgi:hypothetical protein
VASGIVVSSFILQVTSKFNFTEIGCVYRNSGQRQLQYIYKSSGSFHFTEVVAAFILQKERQPLFTDAAVAFILQKQQQLCFYRSSGSIHFTESAAALILQKQRQPVFFTEAAAAFILPKQRQLSFYR